MKVGFLGNTNNYPFTLARALKRKGHDVLFIVSSDQALHRPEYRYNDIVVPYPDWIIDASPLDTKDYVLFSRNRSRIVELLASCDGVVLNDLGPTLLELIGRPGIVLLTGSDLEYFASYRSVISLARGVRNKPVMLKRIAAGFLGAGLIAAQRRGIRSAVAVSYFPPDLFPAGDRLLRDIGVMDDQRVWFYMCDLEHHRLEPPPRNNVVRIFCATRLTWKKPWDPTYCELDYKGGDIMIRGLGLFFRTTGISLDIRLVRKGKHVQETMALAEEEGIAEQITWLEEMSQNSVTEEIRRSDIMFEQLGRSAIGMAGLDAMATGRPLIANGRPEVLERVIGEPSPICQASTPQDVFRHLKRLVADRIERERIGIASRRYVERYFSMERAIEMCIERLAGGQQDAGGRKRAPTNRATGFLRP